MNNRSIALFAIAATLIGVAYFKSKDRPISAPPTARRDAQAPPPDAPKEDLSAEHLQGFGGPNSDIRRDLTMLRDALDALVRSVKVPGALPTAGNREVVRALAGDNAYRIRFIDPAAEFINDAGEITDRWGSPIWFHFVEADDPGLRSAGPDRELWTDDDVLHGEFADAE